MKVNIDKTLEVSDVQRRAIARYLDEPGSKPRDATREEMKEFIWAKGEDWAMVLADSADDDPDQLELEDLL